LWNKLSAEGAGYCEIPTERCFLRNAREAAGNSNLVITNHSLLLADIATAGAALPPYELLIIDEAHHLEDQATRSLGFEINQPVVTDIFDRLTGQDSVTATSASLLRNTLSNENQLTRLNSIISTLSPTVNSVRTNFNTLFGLAAQYLENSRTSNVRGTMRITDHRGSRSWNSLTDLSENIQLEISDIINSLNLLSTLSELHLNINAVQSIQNDVGSLRADLIELNEHLIEVITEPNPTSVYWIREGGRQTYGIFCMAPVEVDEALKQNMFSQKDSVTLTSATLTTNGTFEHILRRLGFNPDASNTLPSPFDYRSTTLTLIPKDLPDPRDDRYLEELSVAIADAAVAASGKTLALFTSHAAIRHGYNRIRNLIEHADSDIEVLAQGISGDTQRLIERLRQNSRCILLGTASMWEGIDVRGEALQVVIITRLPFDVPTDPIYQARSEQYSNAFMDYAVPNAIMKFRQGFGRLIRSSSDRGIFIVMDNRLVRSRYGSKFIESLPSMTVKQCRRDELRESIELWLSQT
jgi:DNA polymerase-3 subunit epsilon/ATP-dependent DNA helicase DinG